MHRVVNFFNTLITGKYSIISIVFSVIIFAFAAYTGSKDNELPLFYLLLIIGVLLFLVHTLVQVIEMKNQEIEAESKKLSFGFIGTPKPYENPNLIKHKSIAIKYDKNTIDDMGFCSVEVIFNTMEKVSSSIDLSLQCHQKIDLRNQGIHIDAHPFQRYFQYHLIEVFNPISNFLYTASFEIRIPKGGPEDVSLKLRIGYEDQEFEEVFLI